MWADLGAAIANITGELTRFKGAVVSVPAGAPRANGRLRHRGRPDHRHRRLPFNVAGSIQHPRAAPLRPERLILPPPDRGMIAAARLCPGVGARGPLTAAPHRARAGATPAVPQFRGCRWTPTFLIGIATVVALSALLDQSLVGENGARPVIALLSLAPACPSAYVHWRCGPGPGCRADIPRCVILVVA